MKRSAFLPQGSWYKGNLHTHSTMSDGKLTPEILAQDYKAKGYQFLAITDHELFHTHKDLCEKDFIIIPGGEVSIKMPSGEKNWHIVGLSQRESPQETIYKMENRFTEQFSAQQTVWDIQNQGNLAILAHPIWSRLSPSDVMELEGIVGIEVFNTLCELQNAAGVAEGYWDLMLRSGKKVWGFASDDTHQRIPVDRFVGWIEAKASSLTQKAIIEAIQKGSFYASTGPRIFDFGVDEATNCVYIHCSDCKFIRFISYESKGQACFSLDGSLICEAQHKLSGNETYIRAECIDAQGRKAWTNPIYFD